VETEIGAAFVVSVVAVALTGVVADEAHLVTTVTRCQMIAQKLPAEEDSLVVELEQECHRE